MEGKNQEALRAAAERAEHPLQLEPDDGDSADEYNHEGEQDNDGAAAAAPAAKPKRKARRVMPTPGSPAANCLDEVKRLVVSDAGFRARIKKGMKWLAPESDPIASDLGAVGDPGRWYATNLWIYIWLPLLVFARLLQPMFPYIFCGSTAPRPSWRARAPRAAASWR